MKKLLKSLSFPRKRESIKLSFRGALATRNLLLLFAMTALFFGTVSCKKSSGLSGAGPSSVGGSSGGTSSATNASGSSNGTVFGGLTPIANATVSLYQAGNNTPIATSTTNAQGGFSLPFSSASGLLYVLATGGNPGSGTNSSIQMIGVVGASSALPTSTVQVNELSTAAFMTVAKDFGIVNDSSGTVTFKAPNNSATINNIVTQVNNFVSAGQLNTGNSNLSANSQKTLSTVADALANCVEGGSSGCSTLMSTATNPSTSANASNILDAANNMLGTTSSSTISSIFSLAQTKAPTTGFALSGGAPSNLAASLALTVNSFASGGTQPEGISIDASGNLWVTNNTSGSATSLSKFSSSGTTLGTFAGTGNGSRFSAIDAAGNIWVDNNNSGTVNEFNSSGSVLGTFSVGLNPESIAIDASGAVYTPNYTSSTVSKLSPSGAPLGSFTAGTNPFHIAIDASGNLWVANTGTTTVTELNSSGTTLGTFTVGNAPEGSGIDSSGNVWVAFTGNVAKLSSSGTTLGVFTTGVLENPTPVVPTPPTIDAVGNVWVPRGGGILVLNSSGVTIGQYLLASLGVTTGNFWPNSITIDSSGNVWVGNVKSGTSTFLELVGAGAGPTFFPYTGPQFPFI